MQSHRYRQQHSGLRPLVIAGAALAATAFAVRQAALTAEKRHPPEGRFIEVFGVRLHFTDSGGSGTPVVLLHGNGLTNDDWRISGVTDLASRNYRVIAFDRPGFGYSERPRGKAWTPDAQADLIKAALDKMGVAQPVIVGHSWAALVAAAFAIRHPQFVRGVVLVAGYYFPSFRADALLFSGPAIPVVGDVLRYTISPIVSLALTPMLVKKMFLPKRVTNKFVSQFPFSLTLRPWQLRATSAEAVSMPLVAGDMESAYPSIRVPTVIISGDSDQVVDFERQSARLHKTIRGSSLRVLAGLGHMVHHFAPEVVVKAIESVGGSKSALGWRRSPARV